MLMRLSDQEAAILLGATLMHWGVPFRCASRHELTDREQAIVDEVSERLIALRGQQQSQPQDVQIHLSDQEADLLAGVVHDCLEECGGDQTELSLQLKTSNRSEVERLLERMRVAMQS